MARHMRVPGLKVTPRQRNFAHEYIVDYKPKEAAIRAGYAEKYANRQAYQLLRNRRVTDYIDEISMSREARIMTVDPDYIISEINRIVQKEGAKDSDKLRGLELLARHLGMFIERQEITGKDGGAIEVEQRRIEEEAGNFTNLLKSMTKKQESVSH